VLLPPHPREFAAYGDGTWIVPPTRVQSPECISIGRRVGIREGTWLCVVPQPNRPAPKLVLADDAGIGRFVKIVCAGEIIIGEKVGIADHCLVADTYYRYDDPTLPILQQPLAEPRPIRIGARAFIGWRSIIKPGVTIGENAYVGAGSVVWEDVPPRTVVVGDPARVVRRYDDATGLWVGPDDVRP
jgi:acetyltransferase-like isoleucine patch superfamily enzyme